MLHVIYVIHYTPPLYIFYYCIIEIDYPSICAEKLINNKVDISLTPVAAIPKSENYKIISNYCIGAVGKVKSVILAGNVPFSEINNIYLDYQSKTSVVLIKIIAAKLWKIKPVWLQSGEGYENLIKNDSAGVIIGDRAITLQKNYKYVYDLSEEWQKLTSLPFVFACWVSNKKIDSDFLFNFNSALEAGTKNIRNIESNIISKQELYDYLTNNLNFNLDDIKTESINTFFTYIDELKLNC